MSGTKAALETQGNSRATLRDLFLAAHIHATYPSKASRVMREGRFLAFAERGERSDDTLKYIYDDISAYTNIYHSCRTLQALKDFGCLSEGAFSLASTLSTKDYNVTRAGGEFSVFRLETVSGRQYNPARPNLESILEAANPWPTFPKWEHFRVAPVSGIWPQSSYKELQALGRSIPEMKTTLPTKEQMDAMPLSRAIAAGLVKGLIREWGLSEIQVRGFVAEAVRNDLATAKAAKAAATPS